MGFEEQRRPSYRTRGRGRNVLPSETGRIGWRIDTTWWLRSDFRRAIKPCPGYKTERVRPLRLSSQPPPATLSTVSAAAPMRREKYLMMPIGSHEPFATRPTLPRPPRYRFPRLVARVGASARHSAIIPVAPEPRPQRRRPRSLLRSAVLAQGRQPASNGSEPSRVEDCAFPATSATAHSKVLPRLCRFESRALPAREHRRRAADSGGCPAHRTGADDDNDFRRPKHTTQSEGQNGVGHWPKQQASYYGGASQQHPGGPSLRPGATTLQRPLQSLSLIKSPCPNMGWAYAGNRRRLGLQCPPYLIRSTVSFFLCFQTLQNTQYGRVRRRISDSYITNVQRNSNWTIRPVQKQ